MCVSNYLITSILYFAREPFTIYIYIYKSVDRKELLIYLEDWYNCCGVKDFRGQYNI